MKALLAQMAPSSDPVKDAGRVGEVVADSGDADLVAFPELFIGGYSTEDPASKASSLNDPIFAALAENCRSASTALVVGFTERLGDGGDRFANSALCLNRAGEFRGVYRKTHLFGPAESAAFEEGDSYLMADLGGHSTGPMICYDVEFPEPARELAVAGADYLLTIASNMDPYGPDHSLCTRARSLDNRRHHLYVNRVGSEAGNRFVGFSRAIAPDGSVIAELGEEEGVLEVEIDPTETSTSDETDYLAHLRPWLPVLGWEEMERKRVGRNERRGDD